VVQIAWLRYSTGKVQPMQWPRWASSWCSARHDPAARRDLHQVEAHRAVLDDGRRAGGRPAGRFRKNFLKSLMGAQLELPDAAWRAMNWSWVGFFAVMGVLNLWVAFNFDDRHLGELQAVRRPGPDGVFVIGQALYLGRT
jgi:intracellular septation protein